MNWIIIIYVVVGIEVAFVAHKLLLKCLPYRWLVGCVTYPLHRSELRKRISKATDDQLHLASYDFANVNGWFTPYWFYRSLVKVIDTEVLKRYNNGTT